MVRPKEGDSRMIDGAIGFKHTFTQPPIQLGVIESFWSTAEGEEMEDWRRPIYTDTIPGHNDTQTHTYTQTYTGWS